MPRPNNRSYRNKPQSSSRNQSRNGGGGSRGSRGKGRYGRSNDDFNMLNFGIAFADFTSSSKGEALKVRMMLKAEVGKKGNKTLIDVIDEQENEYTPEEAAKLVASALLSGKAINMYLFENDDGSFGGNARIDIKELLEGGDLDDDDEDEEEEDEPPVKRKSPTKTKAAATKAKTKAKPKPDYETEIIESSDDGDEDEEGDDDVEELPY